MITSSPLRDAPFAFASFFFSILRFRRVLCLMFLVLGRCVYEANVASRSCVFLDFADFRLLIRRKCYDEK